MRTVVVASMSIAFGMVAAVQANPTNPSPAQYKLTVNKYAEGSLTVRDVQSGSATFDLNYWQCVSQCQNNDSNFWSVNNGVVEGGTIKLSGSAGKYVSNNDEDKELGQCVLYFKFTRQSVSVRQPEKCWWFGVGVNVSGTYRLQPAKAKK